MKTLQPKDDGYGAKGYRSVGSRPSLVVIVGPTASGKSDLAMQVAKKFNGEIICADSRTIYKGMDIGTAKPSLPDRKAIQHWGLDLLEPGNKFSAADFKKYAEETIKDIKGRGKLPILVGGTGLYVDAVLFDFSFVEPRKLPLHWRLTMPMWSISKLQKVIQQNDWPLPENKKNRRHLINTIRRNGRVGKQAKMPRDDALIIGLLPADNVLRNRISKRAEAMFNAGIIEETRRLMQDYGKRTLEGTAGIIYKIVVQAIEGKIDSETAITKFKYADWQYARRQKTWFKRNRYINWFSDQKPAFEFIEKSL